MLDCCSCLVKVTIGGVMARGEGRRIGRAFNRPELCRRCHCLNARTPKLAQRRFLYRNRRGKGVTRESCFLRLQVFCFSQATRGFRNTQSVSICSLPLRVRFVLARSSTSANRALYFGASAFPRAPFTGFVLAGESQITEQASALIAAFLDVGAALFEQPPSQFFAEYHPALTIEKNSVVNRSGHSNASSPKNKSRPCSAALNRYISK